MYGGDVLTVATASGTFNNRHRGIGKQVNISGITLGGTDAGNYNLNSVQHGIERSPTSSQLGSVTWLGGIGQLVTWPPNGPAAHCRTGRTWRTS
jgi:hypothetical protein